MSGSKSPSYGEPKAKETTASTGTRPAASNAMRPASVADSSTDMCTFFWEYVSDADTVSESPSTPASMASSAPFRLGTKAQYVTPGTRSSVRSTSAAPAMEGTERGETN